MLQFIQHTPRYSSFSVQSNAAYLVNVECDFTALAHYSLAIASKFAQDGQALGKKEKSQTVVMNDERLQVSVADSFYSFLEYKVRPIEQ